MNQNNWKQDPRLKQMDPEKLNYLTSFADQITQLPKEQILPAFMSMQADAAQKGIRFSDPETEVLVSVLTSGMSPAEKKKLETLRFIAKKLAARSS
ncbi:MAG: hypothetical protein HFG52_07085 [Lachnospiraceae bacterium]|nr:hypothetical protein [Lachnospiraceae bacterium]